VKQNRREFIKKCGLISAGLVYGGSALMLEGCASVSYIPFNEENNQLVIKKSYFVKEKYGLISYKNLPAPIYITKLEHDNYSAVLLECTHKRCEVSPAGDLLICPCHGSEYSNTGEVLQPPAEKDLYRFGIKTDSENIYVNVENN
jgi:cytochrome b6-f complex iron-sulfur subunit